MYSEHSAYFSTFQAEVARRELCGGESCRGWFCSEIDTWHSCPCPAGRLPHPEDREDEDSMELLVPAPVAPTVSPVDSDRSEDEIPF